MTKRRTFRTNTIVISTSKNIGVCLSGFLVQKVCIMISNRYHYFGAPTSRDGVTTTRLRISLGLGFPT